MVNSSTSVGSEQPSPRDIRDTVLHKVRSLLAKAESSTFEDEAAAFTAKAQELMARHAIDRAMIAESTRGARVRPGERTVHLEAPYAREKYLLLSAVARVNDARAVYCASTRTADLVGFDEDLRTVEVLFTSLLVQATAAMVARGTSEATRRRRYRQSFLIAYSRRIEERLEAARDAAVRAVDEERGGTVLPVLASRAAEVEAELARRFPQLRSMPVTARDARGWRDGTVAGSEAQLGDDASVTGPARRSLGS